VKSNRQSPRRWLVTIGLALVTTLTPVRIAGTLVASAGTQRAAAPANPCAPPSNRIVAENCKPGNPESEWDINGAGDPSIQGFATDMSVNHGETVSFKIRTDATAYRIDVYRIGYYGGMGARLMATMKPSAALPQHQPDCLFELETRLYGDSGHAYPRPLFFLAARRCASTTLHPWTGSRLTAEHF